MTDIIKVTRICGLAQPIMHNTVSFEDIATVGVHVPTWLASEIAYTKRIMPPVRINTPGMSSRRLLDIPSGLVIGKAKTASTESGRTRIATM